MVQVGGNEDEEIKWNPIDGSDGNIHISPEC